MSEGQSHSPHEPKWKKDHQKRRKGIISFKPGSPPAVPVRMAQIEKKATLKLFTAKDFDKIAEA